MKSTTTEFCLDGL